MSSASWLAIGHSSRGAAHLRNGVPNQDALAVSRSDDGRAIVVAVADGHGSARHSRSELGARFAVAVAVRELEAAFRSFSEAGSPQGFRWSAIADAVVDRWRTTILEHVVQVPLEDETAEVDPVVAYGATLIVAGISNGLLVLLQLGDGDVVLVSETGEATSPMPVDPENVANATTSLCMPGASSRMHVLVRQVTGDLPAMLLLATDGYANSFAASGGILQAAKDFLELLRGHGPDAVAAQLPTWLEETSSLGSGDDVSVVLVVREDTSRARAGAPQATSDSDTLQEVASRAAHRAQSQVDCVEGGT